MAQVYELLDLRVQETPGSLHIEGGVDELVVEHLHQRLGHHRVATDVDRPAVEARRREAEETGS